MADARDSRDNRLQTLWLQGLMIIQELRLEGNNGA